MAMKRSFWGLGTPHEPVRGAAAVALAALVSLLQSCGPTTRDSPASPTLPQTAGGVSRPAPSGTKTSSSAPASAPATVVARDVLGTWVGRINIAGASAKWKKDNDQILTGLAQDVFMLDLRRGGVAKLNQVRGFSLSGEGRWRLAHDAVVITWTSFNGYVHEKPEELRYLVSGSGKAMALVEVPNKDDPALVFARPN